MNYENQLEDLKKNLYRLHFLLTEKEDEETKQKSVKQFMSCLEGAMQELTYFLVNEYNVNPKTNLKILDCSFEYKLFNQQMTDDLKNMANDYEEVKSSVKNDQLYNKIKNSYAGYLQMIYDMLTRMGLDAEEEED